MYQSEAILSKKGKSPKDLQFCCKKYTKSCCPLTWFSFSSRHYEKNEIPFMRIATAVNSTVHSALELVMGWREYVAWWCDYDCRLMRTSSAHAAEICHSYHACGHSRGLIGLNNWHSLHILLLQSPPHQHQHWGQQGAVGDWTKLTNKIRFQWISTCFVDNECLLIDIYKTHWLGTEGRYFYFCSSCNHKHAATKHF